MSNYSNIYSKYVFKRMSEYYLFSLSATRNTDLTCSYKHFFFKFIINLRAKSPASKIVKNNIFKDLTYRFCIFFLILDLIYKFFCRFKCIPIQIFLDNI